MSILFFTLIFDPATETAIRNLWHTLASAGLPVVGLNGHRPHLTIAAYQTNDIDSYALRLKTFITPRRKFPLHFHSLIILPEQHALALIPLINPELLHLHAELLDQLEGPGLPQVHYAGLARGYWTPHSTLIGVPPGGSDDILVKALAVLLPRWHPVCGTVEGIGMLKAPCHPVVDLHQFHFADQQTRPLAPRPHQPTPGDTLSLPAIPPEEPANPP